MLSVENRSRSLMYAEQFYYKKILREVNLFRDFSEKSLDTMLTCSSVRRYKKNSMIYDTGSSASFFYIVVSGVVKLYRYTQDGHESIYSVLTSSDFFGKSAIMKQGTHSLNAKAAKDTELLLIPSSFIVQMATESDKYDNFVVKLLESELNESSQNHLRAEQFALMTSAERVGCFLLRLLDEKQQLSATFKLPYEKALVANKLGMTAETFSRTLTKLALLGVKLTKYTVSIDDVHKLCSNTCERCPATGEECPFRKNYSAGTQPNSKVTFFDASQKTRKLRKIRLVN